MAMRHPSYTYAKKVVEGKLTNAFNKPTTAPKYVIKQCRDFIRIADGKDKKYVIDRSRVRKIDGILKLLNMPLGIKSGASLYECTTEYQWLFYIAIFCTVHRADRKKRRYETALLEIARKNFKTYTVGTMFLILMLLEPRFSKFYSVAPDGSLSREIYDAMCSTLKCSPYVLMDPEEKPRWTMIRDYIRCDVTEIKYIPLNYANNRFDGKLPVVFLADEVGALPNNSAIEAMRSGQINITNKLGCIISTKYPKAGNPFEDEVDYAKKVLDGIVKDETCFALLYEPDDPKKWAVDNLVLEQANPVSLESKEIWETIEKKRTQAIEQELRRENFLCKHCNILYQGAASETYVSPDKVKECITKQINWSGREVFVGVDLSKSNDNTSVAIACLDDDGNLLADVWAFIPEGRIEEKNRFEKLHYEDFIAAGKCIACGDMVIDYEVVERFVGTLEATLGCKVRQVGFDPYNCLSSAQKWEKDYYMETVEIKQHSSVLHPATKLLSEKIESGNFRYEKNDLLLINFSNARCTLDTNENRYVNKKKSTGKVDMVVSLINAVYLVYEDDLNNSGFICDVF